MHEKFLAFDLEIATPIPDGETDWKRHRPFGICCAATWASDAKYPLLWHGTANEDGIHEDMCEADVQEVGDYMRWAVSRGYEIISFNGCGFDFDVLAEESGLFQECRDLAYSHIDIFYHLFCINGYSAGLDAIARGMLGRGKPDGVDGAKAPQLWQDGDYNTVLDYCADDVRLTLDIAEQAQRTGHVEWTSRSGKPVRVELPDGWLTVAQASELPEPDTSWMKDPWTRDRFMGWMSA